MLFSKEEVVSKVVKIYSEKYSPEIIAGYRNGYFSVDDDKSVAELIALTKPDILFVGISSPKKELFLDNNKKILNIPFIMGVGGSFDVVSGKVKRAPVWMQDWGLEWFYRLCQEPRRMWKRYLVTNSLFAYYLFIEKLKNLTKTTNKKKGLD